MKTGPRFESLPNLGPRSSAMLAKAGIKSRARLERLGAVGAYLAVKRIWKGASLNLLWALEGALSGRPWQEVARTERLRLLMELEARQPAAPRTRRKNTT